MGKHRTTKGRNQRQKLKKNYAKMREEAQLTGVIPTVPEGAVRDERVDPRAQSEQKIPSLDRQAVVKGWSVPEETKRMVVERLAEPFFEVDPDKIDRYLLKENAKVLVLADQRQYERDNPEEAGKAKGSTNVNVALVDPMILYQAALREVMVDEVEDRLLLEQNGSQRDVKGTPTTGPSENDVAGGEVLPRAAVDDKELGRE